MADTEMSQRVEIALAQAKKVRRESGFLVQMLGGLRDTLHPQEGQGQDGKEDTHTVEG